MHLKSTALFALFVPSLAMLASCNRAADEAASTPAAAVTPSTTDTVTTDTVPADDMASTPSMTGDEMPFASMDKNQDGAIAKDELADTDMLYQHFSVADADGDGKLSDAEITKHRADMANAPAK